MSCKAKEERGGGGGDKTFYLECTAMTTGHFTFFSEQ